MVALVLGYLAGYLLADVLGTSPDLTGALVALGAVGLTFVWLRARGRDLLSGEASAWTSVFLLGVAGLTAYLTVVTRRRKDEEDSAS